MDGPWACFLDLIHSDTKAQLNPIQGDTKNCSENIEQSCIFSSIFWNLKSYLQGDSRLKTYSNILLTLLGSYNNQEHASILQETVEQNHPSHENFHNRTLHFMHHCYILIVDLH